MKQRIDELTAQINKLTVERNELRKQYAVAQTGLKIGDRVAIQGRPETWQLHKIATGYTDKSVFFGMKIRKDGTPGVRVSRIWLGRGDALVKVG